MHKVLLLLLFAVPGIVLGQQFTYSPQKKTYIGIHLSPSVLNMLDARLEKQVHRNIAVQVGLGFRYQNHENSDKRTVGYVGDYSDLKNTGAYLSVGGRIFDRRQVREYPYLAFDIAGNYFNDKVVTEVDFQTGEVLSSEDFNAFRMGFSGTIGFVIQLLKRFHADLGLQAGYSPPVENRGAYYYGGLGFTTYGLADLLDARGLHMQPVVTLKYDLFKDKRDKIREMD